MNFIGVSSWIKRCKDKSNTASIFLPSITPGKLFILLGGNIVNIKYKSIISYAFGLKLSELQKSWMSTVSQGEFNEEKLLEQCQNVC